MKKTLEQLFDDLYFELNESEIREFYRSNPTSQGLSLMFKGIYDYCYFAFTNSDKIEEVTAVNICYIQYKKEVKAFGVEIPIFSEFSNELAFKLACHLQSIDSDLELIETFNQLQNYRSFVLEDCGYMVINTTTNKMNGEIFSIGQRGIIDVWTYSRKLFYEKVMSPIIDKTHKYPDSKIYLMLDNKTGFFKIGRSKKPKVREKTLQSENPETYLLAEWSAPKSTEKELHTKYAKFRKRGEWFKLTLKELYEIKEFMGAI